MKKLFLLFHILMLPIFGIQEEPIRIESGEVQYNGKEVALSGNVTVQNSLGKISSQHLTLVPSTDKSKQSKIALLMVEGDVLIDLKEGGQLRCQNARFDFEEMKGVFRGNDMHPDVIYNDMETNSAAPLILKCHQMTAILAQQPSHTYLKQIRADGDTRIHYEQEYLVLADYAVFERQLDANSKASGVLTMAMYDPDLNSCTIISQKGDRIESKQIITDTDKRQLRALKSHGSLSVDQQGKSPLKVIFSAENLTLDQALQMLHLENKVKIEEPGLREIKTDREIKIFQHSVNGHKAIRTMVSTEDTELLLLDPQKKLQHKLICHGPLTVDHEHSSILFKSPAPDLSGTVAQEHQVYFEDTMGEIYADQMQLDYADIQGRPTPTKLRMEGQVSILNRFDGHVAESSSVLQYALADQVDYFPNSEEMILHAQNGKRVLVYDKVNNVQMSAPTFKLKRSEGSGKGSIQGVGDVRFTFIEGELDKLRAHFSQYKKSEGE